MAEIRRTRAIAAAPQDIWEVLADFGSISSWADNVDHSCILTSGPDGTTRRVQVGRDVLVERIIECDPPRTLVYRIEGLPRWLGWVTNRWTVGSGEVSLTSTVEIGRRPGQLLAERVACRVLARQSDVMLAGLAHRLENTRD